MRCHIRIKGRLDPSWQEWFEHLDILPDTTGRTLLSGSLPDQAALYRILLKLRHLGFLLLSLEVEEFPFSEQEKE